jgi:hypothetical protein
MSTRISSGRSQSPGIAPEFISEVEDELSRRLGQPVTMVLGAASSRWELKVSYSPESQWL